MTPNQKAVQLLDRFKFYVAGDTNEQELQCTKQCALICVDEILAFMESDDLKHKDCSWINSTEFRFWEQVKEEIKKL